MIFWRKQKKEELCDSGEQYRLLFESNPHPMWVYDLKTLSFIAVNDAAVQHYGYSRDEFLGMTIKDIRPPEDIPALLENVAKVTAGLDKAGVWRHRKKDGSIIYVEITSHTLIFEGRRAEVVLANDVTERSQAEEKLRLFRNLIDKSNDAIFVNEPETGRILDANDKACINLGYMREELLNMKVFEIEAVIPDQFSWKEHVKDIQKKGSLILEGQHRRKDGTTFPVEVNVNSIILGKNSYMVAVARDITERKRAEEEMKIKALLLDRATDSIFVHDLEGNFIYMNEAAYRSRGYGKDEMMGVNLNSIVIPQYARLIKTRIKELLEKGEAVYESAHFDKKKSIIPVEVHSCVIESGGRKLVLGVARDISERKRAEKMLRENARAELYGFIVSALPVFASGVPSQVRNAIVSNFAERFERNVRPRFEEEMKRLGLKTGGSRIEDTQEMLNIFMLWLAGLFFNLGIRTRTTSSGTGRRIEFLNCPWIGEAKGNPIFCFICRTIVIRSLTWTSLKGSANQDSSIANGSLTCKFELHF